MDRKLITDTRKLRDTLLGVFAKNLKAKDDGGPLQSWGTDLYDLLQKEGLHANLRTNRGYRVQSEEILLHGSLRINALKGPLTDEHKLKIAELFPDMPLEGNVIEMDWYWDHSRGLVWKSKSGLRASLIRLAERVPELRKHVVPLLKKSTSKKD